MANFQPLLFLPSPRILLPKQYVIDWTHPLTNGLIGCWLPGISHGLNLAGFANQLAYDTAPQGDGATLEGPSHRFNQAHCGLVGTASNEFLSNPITWYWRGRTITQNTGTSSDLCGVSNNASPTIATGSINHNGTVLSAFWNHGGTLANFTIATFPSANTLFSTSCSFPGPGANVTAYLNGVQSGTPTAFGAGAATNSSPQVCIGSINIAKTNFPATDTICAYAWSRVLDAEEHKYLDQNPYCFLVAQQQFDSIIATDLPIIGTLNVTEANDTISAAGEVPILGTLTQTEANDTLAAVGMVDGIFGTLDIIEVDDTISALGFSGDIIGDLSITEADDTLSSTGYSGIDCIGTLSVTEDDDTIVAFGGEPRPPTVAQRIPGIEWQTWDRAFEPKRSYI